MTTRYLLLCFLLCLGVVDVSATDKTISIRAERIDTLRLSEIASDVTPVILEKLEFSSLSGVLTTKDYLFVAGESAIAIYSYSGKKIRTIYFSTWLDCMAVDTVNQVIYAAIGRNKQVLGYNYLGKKVFEAGLNHEKKFDSILSMLYHNSRLWFLTYRFDTKETAYEMFCYDFSFKRSFPIPFSRSEKRENGSVGISSTGTVSFWKDSPVVSISTDSVLFKVDSNKSTPIFQWRITPTEQSMFDKGILQKKGLAGRFLFVNYNRTDPKDRTGLNNTTFLYIEDLKTGKSYNLRFLKGEGNGIISGTGVDDIYSTGHFAFRSSMPDGNRFWFLKEVKDKMVGGRYVKGNVVIFIVKVKS